MKIVLGWVFPNNFMHATGKQQKGSFRGKKNKSKNSYLCSSWRHFGTILLKRESSGCDEKVQAVSKWNFFQSQKAKISETRREMAVGVPCEHHSCAGLQVFHVS